MRSLAHLSLILLPALPALLLGGCADMPPSGSPFSPVAVEAAPGPVPEPASEDPAFAVFDEEPFTLSSEDLRTGTEPGTKAPAGDGAPVEAPTPEAVGGEAPPVTSAPPSGAASGWSATAPAGWPVRLVSTVPDAQPPRAILGMPDGREIVASPGTMVPELGMVVMAVGRGQVEVARIQAQGDHATVASQTLTAQF